MEILILSAGRATRKQQVTAANLAAAGIGFKVVVQAHEVDAYEKVIEGSQLIALPGHIRTVSATRDCIIHDMGTDKPVLMLDDDLDFAARRLDERDKFEQMAKQDYWEMFDDVEGRLKIHPMVSIGSREGGNRNIEQYMLNTRMMRALAFDRRVLQDLHITFSPMELMEDFHVALQLMRAGCDTCVVNNWVTNQRGGSGATGGCSTYRTPELQTAEANKLAARHPGFVKVVQKTTKGAWGGGTRTDVMVQWKQARKAGFQYDKRK